MLMTVSSKRLLENQRNKHNCRRILLLILWRISFTAVNVPAVIGCGLSIGSRWMMVGWLKVARSIGRPLKIHRARLQGEGNRSESSGLVLLYFTRGSFSYHLLPEMHSQLVRSILHSQRIHVSRCIAWCGLVWLGVT